MYLSLKYIILYTCTGGIAGYIASGDKKVALIGLALAGIFGYSFGINYALISALEFGAGFIIGSIIKKKNL